MASAQELTQNPPTSVVQHNHIVIRYQQPPDLAILNHVLEILIGITRTFSWRNPAQIPYIQDYINQITPLLQTLYNQSAQQILMQGGMPSPASNTTYLPPAHENLQKLFSELSNVQTSSLGMMAHLQFWKKWEMEQSTPPSTSSQTNKII